MGDDDSCCEFGEDFIDKVNVDIDTLISKPLLYHPLYLPIVPVQGKQ
jgi:hypothetical protein